MRRRDDDEWRLGSGGEGPGPSFCSRMLPLSTIVSPRRRPEMTSQLCQHALPEEAGRGSLSSGVVCKSSPCLWAQEWGTWLLRAALLQTRGQVPLRFAPTLKPKPQCDSVRSRGLWEVMTSRRRTLTDGISALIKETQSAPSPPSIGWGHRENTALTRHGICWRLDLGLPAPGTVRNNISAVDKPPVLW